MIDLHVRCLSGTGRCCGLRRSTARPSSTKGPRQMARSIWRVPPILALVRRHRGSLRLHAGGELPEPGPGLRLISRVLLNRAASPTSAKVRGQPTSPRRAEARGRRHSRAVAPVVVTSSMSRMRRPSMRCLVVAGYPECAAEVLGRAARLRPTWERVARTLCSVRRQKRPRADAAMSLARSAAWLNRRRRVVRGGAAPARWSRPRQSTSAAARHHPRHDLREVEAVLVFQAVHEAPATPS